MCSAPPAPPPPAPSSHSRTLCPSQPHLVSQHKHADGDQRRRARSRSGQLIGVQTVSNFDVQRWIDVNGTIAGGMGGWVEQKGSERGRAGLCRRYIRVNAWNICGYVFRLCSASVRRQLGNDLAILYSRRHSTQAIRLLSSCGRGAAKMSLGKPKPRLHPITIPLAVRSRKTRIMGLCGRGS